MGALPPPPPPPKKKKKKKRKEKEPLLSRALYIPIELCVQRGLQVQVLGQEKVQRLEITSARDAPHSRMTPLKYGSLFKWLLLIKFRVPQKGPQFRELNTWWWLESEHLLVVGSAMASLKAQRTSLDHVRKEKKRHKSSDLTPIRRKPAMNLLHPKTTDQASHDV